ncbi:helix-turn-helix domain-containing protein [Marinoscillum sp.]|uniref:helix-turn-helix domain-containing protein n=1 Tax=Marinoscillum sp. TaxID=2024838 RepID=UPI003BABBEBE
MARSNKDSSLDSIAVAKLIQDARIASNLTQEQVSDLSGVPLRTIVETESGRLKRYSLSNFIAISSVLKYGPEVLIQELKKHLQKKA